MTRLGLRSFLLVFGGALLSMAAGNDSAGVPVLLELFTSEGCSSCPPADRLLQVFDQSQPVAGANLIVLSEHVDYWDRLGWKDPFSSPQFTARQQAYADRYSREGPYTPQLVVDGRFALVGSDSREANVAIQKAAREPKLAVVLSNAARDGKQVKAHIEVPAAPNARRRSAVLCLAIADNRAESGCGAWRKRRPFAGARRGNAGPQERRHDRPPQRVFQGCSSHYSGRGRG